MKIKKDYQHSLNNLGNLLNLCFAFFSFPKRLIFPIARKTHCPNINSRIFCQQRFEFLCKSVIGRNGKKQIFDNTYAIINAFCVCFCAVYPRENRRIWLNRNNGNFSVPSTAVMTTQISQINQCYNPRGKNRCRKPETSRYFLL